MRKHAVHRVKFTPEMRLRRTRHVYTRMHSSSTFLPHSCHDADKFIHHSRSRRVHREPLSIAVDHPQQVAFPRFLFSALVLLHSFSLFSSPSVSLSINPLLYLFLPPSLCPTKRRSVRTQWLSIITHIVHLDSRFLLSRA